VFYYEKKDALGRWWPRTSEEMPSKKGVEGDERTIRCIKEIPPELLGEPLTALHQALGTGGLLQAAYRDVKEITG
jgi:hypothetical protein